MIEDSSADSGGAAGLAIGVFSYGGCPPFPGLVLDGGATILALHALRPLCTTLGTALRGDESIAALLERWPRLYPDLLRIVAAPGFASLRGQAIAIDSLRVHAPVAPRQVFCTIANYRSGAAQAAPDTDANVRARCDQRVREGHPYVAIKLPSTVIGPYDAIVLPAHVQRPDWEVELGVVIGRPARDIDPAEATEYIAGYTVVNDITVRELVARADPPGMGTDWIQAKCAPGFLPTGPFLVPAAGIPDPYALALRLRLNGEVMQSEQASDMIFDIAAQIAYLSRHVQLMPGDLVCTGSPAGFGQYHGRFLAPGDLLEASIAGLGSQRNVCVSSPDSTTPPLGTSSTTVSSR
jgi:2-keto-4-pentenoate hydratase/2-oxohepta-3-ene-1,7-dioic acid hydratase in catechol pathway